MIEKVGGGGGERGCKTQKVGAEGGSMEDGVVAVMAFSPQRAKIWGGGSTNQNQSPPAHFFFSLVSGDQLAHTS